MVSDTLAREIERYSIGPKIRSLRQNKKLGLAQLGEHTGLSPALLSKVERGLLFPTLPTLVRIAMVFGVGLEHFFVEGEGRPQVAVVRKGDRLRLPARPDETAPAYFFESLDFPVTDRAMDAYHAVFPAGATASPPHEHEGAELIYVLGGRLAVGVGGEETILEAGDAMYFDPSVPHSYRCEGAHDGAAVVVVVP